MRAFGMLLPLLLAGCAGSSDQMRSGGDRPERPEPGNALVWFVRPSASGALTDFPIWDGHRLAGVSVSKSCFAYSCPAGRRFFVATGLGSSAVSAELAAGKTYYLVLEARREGIDARVALVPVVPGSEYWEKAAIWARELPLKSAVPAALRVREKKEKDEIEEVLDHYLSDAGRRHVAGLPERSGR